MKVRLNILQSLLVLVTAATASSSYPSSRPTGNLVANKGVTYTMPNLAQGTGTYTAPEPITHSKSTGSVETNGLDAATAASKDVAMAMPTVVMKTLAGAGVLLVPFLLRQAFLYS